LEEQKIKKFREEIEIGEKSGMVSNFDPEAHLANLHKKHL
jgi:antitoxin ParD1/3/4